MNLMETLVALASHNRAIVCTIHQPQSSIYSLFDKILLLSHGQTMYFGPAQDAVTYFSQMGYSCPPFSKCELYANVFEFILRSPSDFFLDQVSVDTRGVQVERESKEKIAFLAGAYQTSTWKKQNENMCLEWKREKGTLLNDLRLLTVGAFDFAYYFRIDPNSYAI
jgi:ABC-type multidrug transport system ATPase subunit